MEIVAPALVLFAFLFGLVMGMRQRGKAWENLNGRLKVFHDELVRLSRRGPCWTRVHVPREGRGPNADELYNGVLINGQGFLFTYEDCRDARARSAKHWK